MLVQILLMQFDTRTADVINNNNTIILKIFLVLMHS